MKDHKFCLVSVQDGGAVVVIYNYQDTLQYLYMGFSEWEKAADKFKNTSWKPGMFMEYPNGWIFCVKT